MIPWKEIDRVNVPGNEGEITLLQRGTEFSIRIAGTELMNSRVHGSEDALAELACHRMTDRTGVQILIGGLGMGYTLCAALEHSGPDAQVTVAELVPAVVQWNREHLGHLAGMPLSDPRTAVRQDDVANVIQEKKSSWDAILLDVDNGPDGLTQTANDRLYSSKGLAQAFWALRPGGILAVWSCASDEAFTLRLKRCGFKTQKIGVRARKSKKGSRHTIWLAAKPL